MPPTDPDEFLMGGGGRSATFEKGDRYEGEILSKSVRQQTDFKTKKPLFWDDGRPREQMVVSIQTDLDEPDEDGGEDDGVRNLYIKYKMKEAVAKAVREAGEKKLEIGGWLAVECVGTEKPKTRGAQGAKLYEAEYEPPDEKFFAGDEDDPDADDEPPARSRRAPAKKAAAKATSRRRPEPEDDPDPDEEPAPRRSARKAPAKAASRGRAARSSRSAAYEDGGEDEGF